MYVTVSFVLLQVTGYIINYILSYSAFGYPLKCYSYLKKYHLHRPTFRNGALFIIQLCNTKYIERCGGFFNYFYYFYNYYIYIYIYISAYVWVCVCVCVYVADAVIFGLTVPNWAYGFSRLRQKECDDMASAGGILITIIIRWLCDTARNVEWPIQ